MRLSALSHPRSLQQSALGQAKPEPGACFGFPCGQQGPKYLSWLPLFFPSHQQRARWKEKHHVKQSSQELKWYSYRILVSQQQLQPLCHNTNPPLIFWELLYSPKATKHLQYTFTAFHFCFRLLCLFWISNSCHIIWKNNLKADKKVDH